MSEFGKRARAAGHLPIKVYALVSDTTEYEFDNWEELCAAWSQMKRPDQLRHRTVLRSVWRR